MMKPNILVITFEGLLSPVFQNQFMPTMLTLSTKLNFSIIAVERHGLSRKKRIIQEKENLKKKGIRCFPIPLLLFPLKLSLPMNNAMVTFFTLALLLVKKIDILHIRRYDANFAALIAKKIFGKKLIFDPRGLFIEEKISSGSWQRNRFRFWIYKYLENSILKQSDAVIAFSRPHRKYLQSTYGQKISKKVALIPNCVDLDKFKCKRKYRDDHFAEKITLVYIGGASHWHMVDEMIDFFKELKRIVPSFFLYITYEDQRAIKKKFSESGLGPEDFTVMGVPPSEIPKYLCHADVGMALIAPSLAKKMCAPIKFVEYLAAGLPVVINPGLGETEEIVKKYRVGVLYDLKMMKTNIEKLISLLGESGIHQRCRSVAEKHFALDEAVNRLTEVYDKVLQSGKERATFCKG